MPVNTHTSHGIRVGPVLNTLRHLPALIVFPVIAALPFCITTRYRDTMPARLAPEDVEGLDGKDLAHPDIA